MILKKIHTDIRFWIVLAFLIRLIGTTNPPIEVGHNWRQTTVTMVSRNFSETGPELFYPRIDIAGEKTGITGMEFPVFNYLIYLMSSVFGYAHWYGRLINLVFSSIGLLFYFKLSEFFFNRKVSFYSTIVLMCSIWFMFSRKIMPDTFSMSLIISGMYFGMKSLVHKSSLLNLLLYTLLVGIGLLSKISSGYLLILFLPFVLSREIKPGAKLFFLTGSTVLLIPCVIWYFYWVEKLVEDFGFWHFYMGKNILTGMKEITDHLPQTMSRFYDSAMKYIGFGLFLFGVFQAIRQKNRKLILILTLSSASFLVIMLKAGFAFYHHNYYIIPFVPVMALLCGYGISQIKRRRWEIMVIVAIAIEGIVNQYPDFKNNRNLEILSLEKDLDRVSERNELILINSGEYPTPMYFAHRKGWVNYNHKIKDSNYIEELKGKGLKYIVILKKSFGQNLILDYEQILDNENYCVYKL